MATGEVMAMVVITTTVTLAITSSSRRMAAGTGVGVTARGEEGVAMTGSRVTTTLQDIGVEGSAVVLAAAVAAAGIIHLPVAAGTMIMAAVLVLLRQLRVTAVAGPWTLACSTWWHQQQWIWRLQPLAAA